MGKPRLSEKLTGKEFCMLFLADPVEWVPDLSQKSRSRTSFSLMPLSRAFSFPVLYSSYTKRGPVVFSTFHL